MHDSSRSLRLPVPELIGGKDKGRLLLSHKEKLSLQLFRHPDIIRIQKSDIPAPGRIHSGIARHGCPLVLIFFNQTDGVVLIRP